jgi:hypothetical protein
MTLLTEVAVTILNLPYTGFDVVECQIGHGILQAVEVHLDRFATGSAFEWPV